MKLALIRKMRFNYSQPPTTGANTNARSKK